MSTSRALPLRGKRFGVHRGPIQEAAIQIATRSAAAVQRVFSPLRTRAPRPRRIAISRGGPKAASVGHGEKGRLSRRRWRASWARRSVACEPSAAPHTPGAPWAPTGLITSVFRGSLSFSHAGSRRHSMLQGTPCRGSCDPNHGCGGMACTTTQDMRAPFPHQSQASAEPHEGTRLA